VADRPYDAPAEEGAFDADESLRKRHKSLPENPYPCYITFWFPSDSPFPIPPLPATKRPLGYNHLAKIRRGGAKKFGIAQKGFFASQAFEIAQNRQRNLWKSLTKSLENLTKSLENLQKIWRLRRNPPSKRQEPPRRLIFAEISSVNLGPSPAARS
jgi:hypothetical protein